MSTPAYIAIIEPDGSGRRISLSMDGYATWAGRYLLLHYSERHEIEALIGLGNLLTLGASHLHTPGTFITESYAWDKLSFERPTRAFNRESGGIHTDTEAKPFTGGLDGLYPDGSWRPHAYAWTNDGWFAAEFDDETSATRFVPLLQFIHEEHRQQYEGCQAGKALGPYMVQCTAPDHGHHGIRLLQTILPPELLPKDQEHPTFTLAHAFPPEALECLKD